MPKPSNISETPAELRQRAEARLATQRKNRPANERNPQSAADAQRLVQELEIHQIELEIQNGELQQARTELELALEKFTDLYDFAPIGYLTLDREQVIREINLAGASLLGKERSALVDRRFDLFVSLADRPAFNAFSEQVFASKTQQSCEVKLQLKAQLMLDVAIEAIAFESGSTCRLTLWDITVRKRVEADRLILDKLASAGILAGGIAHDFNNLLAVVVLNVDLALMLGSADPELVRHLETAKQTSMLARRLTSQLVTLAEGGALIKTALVVSDLIEESTRLALYDSNVRSEFSLAEDLWATEVDAGLIGQVICNLILNAREAMPAGGVVSVHGKNITLGSGQQTSLPAGKYVRLSITDQGPGIAKEVLSKIFDPYFSTKQRGEKRGMGLGLTICHSVVKKHGGAMVVESVMGSGTTVHIYLPAVHLPAGNITAPPAKPIPPHHKILVMDDEEALRKVIGVALQRMGHTVELTADGQSAIAAYQNARAQKQPFDLVLLDLMVSGSLGGKETLQALRQFDPGVKAIVMSGYPTEPVVLEYAKHGFKGVLIKPFDRDKLVEVLTRVGETARK